MEVVLSIKELYTETRAFLEGKAVSGGLETTLSPPPEGPVPLPGTSGGGSRAGDGPCPPQLDSPQEEEALHGPLSVLGQELQRLLDIHWLGPIAHPTEEVGAPGLGGCPGWPQHPAQSGFLQETAGSTNKGSFKLRLNIPKPRKDKDKVQKQKTNSALPGKAGGAPGRGTGTAHVAGDPRAGLYIGLQSWACCRGTLWEGDRACPGCLGMSPLSPTAP